MDQRRISIKKIFIGKWTLFSFYFGVFFWFIFVLFSSLFYNVLYSFIEILLADASVDFQQRVLNAFTDSFVIVLIISFPLVVVLTMLFFVIFALFYNLSAKIKGDLHFGMEEIVTDEIKTI